MPSKKLPKSQSSSQSQSPRSPKRLKLSSSISARTRIKVRTVKLDSEPKASLSTQRIDPLTAFSRTAAEPESSQSQSLSTNRKGKAKVLVPLTSSQVLIVSQDHKLDKDKAKSVPFTQVDDRLWVDIYAPTTEAELAVHVKKVESVRQWFDEAFTGGPSGKLRKYRRILALTGPAGSAKTATIRVLAKEMGFDILEWRNAMDVHSAVNTGEEHWRDESYESLMSKFDSFIQRGSSCSSIFDNTSVSSSSKTAARHVVLLEDLPNVLHASTQERFQSTISAVITSSSTSSIPIVVIVSDTGARGEAMDEQPSAWTRDKDGAMDIQSVLGKDLLAGPYVTQIKFNKIASTLLRKALQNISAQYYGSISSTKSLLSKDALDVIVDSSNGDIRCAIMTLQFSFTTSATSSGRSSKSKKGGGSSSKVKSRFMIEAVTRRENSLVLFHLLGKVFYNKRKGDPPSSNLTIREKQRLKQIDENMPDPHPLPPFLHAHERKTSRFDVDAMYAESPIDSSLFSLYIHQNYVAYCDEIEQCSDIADHLSWVDAGCGADLPMTGSSNPFRFHLLSLGTLHSLPVPVNKRGHQMLKPSFFEALKKQREADEGVDRARRLILSNAHGGQGWGRKEIATELGGWLNARPDIAKAICNNSNRESGGSGSRSFWTLKYVRGDNTGADGEALDEDEDGGEPAEEGMLDEYQRGGSGLVEEVPEVDWWREGDDIEDWDS